MFSKLQLCVYNYNVANLSPTINKIVIFLTDPFCFLLIFCKGQYLILGNPVHLDIRNWCFLTVLLSYSYHYYLLLTFVLSWCGKSVALHVPNWGWGDFFKSLICIHFRDIYINKPLFWALLFAETIPKFPVYVLYVQELLGHTVVIVLA